MDWFKCDPGESAIETRNLTQAQLGAYMRLLWWTYRNERPLPLDTPTLNQIALVKRGREAQNVEVALARFFTKTEAGYVHNEAAKAIGEYRGDKRRQRSGNGRSMAGQWPVNGGTSQPLDDEKLAEIQVPDDVVSDSMAPRREEKRIEKTI